MGIKPHPEEGKQRGEALISSPWLPTAGCVGTAPSCARGCRLGIRKRFLTRRVAKHCDSLPRGGGCPTSVSVQGHLENALRNLLELLARPEAVRQLEEMIMEVPSN